MKILVTPTSLQPNKGGEALKVLQDFSNDLVFNELGRPLTEDELIPLLKDCDGYVAGLDYVTEKVISSCPNLKVISRYGAGYDRVDIAVAKATGVPVTNTPGVNAEAVGELAFSLILSLARRIPYLNQSTRSGGWVRSTGMELKGKTIGIMGLGAIGKVVARCAGGFEMNVLAYDPYVDKDYCTEHKIGIRTFDEVIAEADVISLHLPLTDSTRHLINSDTIAQMKPSAILINTSRGGIIDEDAAYYALKESRLGGLGLDAFEIEPPTESKLFELDNVVVTPHTGAHTKEATENMAYGSIRNLIDVLSGKECPFIVNR
ncbi:phosphoglycerate dehydrogenase [Faecalicatena contorta]|uniref:D-3-phosphoglycerate dehydrogenase n=1 Tax=Faecalicatena contorta TaxID=39482 RepID=A0A316A0H5_9FIRM|nr:phosphoglycerate dehydrogenase [Faecalicatena contorta]PWJ50590.1 D-3-phosphoglycerate dehydrogenase [Faecalicatena contorta]SUQ13998.1 D-3-phosphoglycerate dehydrogenase [Faecalicatena contorta]